jgi:Spy/CpxP family protein refolding chaperone
MKLSRLAIGIYVGLVFASGAVLGAFGHRLYSVSAVVSAKQNRNPEEFRKRVVAEMQGRLKLTDAQVTKLNFIMDDTRARVEETRQKMRPALQAIHEEQSQKIRNMLAPEQQAEYDRMRKEREERQKQTGHPGGPGI